MSLSEVCAGQPKIHINTRQRSNAVPYQLLFPSKYSGDVCFRSFQRAGMCGWENRRSREDCVILIQALDWRGEM